MSVHSINSDPTGALPDKINNQSCMDNFIVIWIAHYNALSLCSYMHIVQDEGMLQPSNLRTGLGLGEDIVCQRQ